MRLPVSARITRRPPPTWHDAAIDRTGRRAEFCLGSGAHTHYFTDAAAALAAEIDRLVSAPLMRGR